MELKILVLVSAMSLACAATIQDPYIHDSVEDQIAMESGARRSVVAPPPHLVEASADSAEETDATPTDDDVADASAADASAADDDEAPIAEEEAETQKGSAVPEDSFSILLNDEPERQQPSQFGQTFGGFSLAQPGRPNFRQPQPSLLSLLSRMQYPSLGGYGSPVVVLQPIFVAMPMESHAADEKPAGGQSQGPSLFRRQPVRRPQNVNLMDLIQRGYFAY